MRQFLRRVVELTLAERIGELKEFQLGLEVFGRDTAYDPRIDPVVRVEARRAPGKARRVLLRRRRGRSGYHHHS